MGFAAYGRAMKNYKPIDGERWAVVPGFAGKYEVSSLGRVRSKRAEGWKLLSLGVKKYGYRVVVMARPEGGQKGFNVHRLVAAAFVPNPHSLPEVNHKDSSPANNAAENLEWMTHRENMAHAIKFRGGSWRRGPKGKRMTARNPDTGELTRFDSIRAAAEWLSALTVAAGGKALNVPGVAANLCTASNGIGQAYGFEWYRGNGPRKISKNSGMTK